jgi:hypothetical protein
MTFKHNYFHGNLLLMKQQADSHSSDNYRCNKQNQLVRAKAGKGQPYPKGTTAQTYPSVSHAEFSAAVARHRTHPVSCIGLHLQYIQKTKLCYGATVMINAIPLCT